MFTEGHSIAKMAGATISSLHDKRLQALSLLFKRLQCFTSSDHIKPLEQLSLDFREFSDDRSIWSDRSELGKVIVLESGFAYEFTFLPGGRRHLSDFFAPGAVCNWSRLSAFREKPNLLFKAGSRIALICPAELENLLRDNALLGNAFQRKELSRTMRKSQRVRALISGAAPEKLLILLLDLHDEYAASDIDLNQIQFPLTQQEMADMVGMTPVHVSRTLTRLERDGLVRRSGNGVALIDRDSLADQLAYRRFFDPPEHALLDAPEIQPRIDRPEL